MDEAMGVAFECQACAVARRCWLSTELGTVEEDLVWRPLRIV